MFCNYNVLFEFTRADTNASDTGGLEVIFGQNLQTPKVELMARLGKAAATLIQTGSQDCYQLVANIVMPQGFLYSLLRLNL